MKIISQQIVTRSVAKGLGPVRQRFFTALRMIVSVVGLVGFAVAGVADVSVTASVDQSHINFGESVTLTIAVNGTHNVPAPAIPKVDGLSFAGPSVSQNFSMVNGQINQSVSLVYQVTPARTGEFIIPALALSSGGKTYPTEPIKLTVGKPGVQPELQQSLFARVRLNSQQLYIGQTAPLDVIVFARTSLPVRNISGFSAEADGLGYKYNNNVKTGNQVINGEAFNVYLIEGAISPTRGGSLNFGPGVIKVQLAVQSRSRSMIDEMLGRTEVREIAVPVEAVPLEALPLPAEGKPADFAGAIGQWNLEVEAKPTAVAVGDPITLTVKLTGAGNVDTVPPVQMKNPDNFKAYDPTAKTTKNDLNTTGERIFQQVLVPKDITATQLPPVQLSYFDPLAKAYRSVTRGPIPIKVTAGTGNHVAIVSGALRARPSEKLGQDIVYLKGAPGPVLAPVFVGTPLFWLLNLGPVCGLAGALVWKRRRDKLTGDIAYARRSRAARLARKTLSAATTSEAVQRGLQEYLGNRLNIPASGITASVVEERQLPGQVRVIFEACDAARFAGAALDVAALKQQVEQVIDELES